MKAKAFSARSVGLLIAVGLLVVGLALSRRPPRSNTQTIGCISNLKQIQGAIEQWALENKITNVAHRVTMADISGSPTNYIKQLINKELICPAGGSYSVTTVGEVPRCSVAGHTL